MEAVSNCEAAAGTGLDTDCACDAGKIGDQSAPSAPVPRHPECVSGGQTDPEISSSKILRHGGPRANSGGPRPNSGGARENSGGARPGSGRKPLQLASSVLREVGPRWYCVQTEPGYELAVIHDLFMLGFHELHFPVYVDADHPRAELMFPGYGFVLFDRHQEAWRDIPHRPRVVQVFGTADAPVPIPVGAVEWLIEQAGPGGVIDVRRWREEPRPSDDIGPGVTVRVVDGPFAKFLGVVDEDAGRRITALLDVFGRTVPTELDRTAVERV